MKYFSWIILRINKRRLTFLLYYQVGDNWDELPGTASYCDINEGSSSDGAGGSGASGGHSRLGAGPSSAAVGDGHGCQYSLDQEKQLPGVVMASQGRDVFSMLYELAQLEEPQYVNYFFYYTLSQRSVEIFCYTCSFLVMHQSSINYWIYVRLDRILFSRNV